MDKLELALIVNINLCYRYFNYVSMTLFSYSRVFVTMVT